MKKILVIEGRESIGGGQIMTKRICDALSSEYEISVFVPGKNNEISNLLGDYNLYHYSLKRYGNGRKHLADYFRFIKNMCSVYVSLHKLLKTEHFDLLYVQHLNALPFVILADWRKRIPLLAHVHVVYIDKFVRRFMDFLLRKSVVSSVLGVSHFALSQFSEPVLSKSQVLYNPLQQVSYESPQPTNHHIAIIGDVMESKGHHVLFEAMRHLPDDYRLFVIGNQVDPEYMDRLNAIYDKAVYTGMIHHVPDFLHENAISVVVVVSVVQFETFSLAMTESWAQGIPTLATDAFGMKELVEHFLPKYRDDLLFPLGDSTTLQSKIKEMFADKSKYRSVSMAVRNVIDKQLNATIFSDKLHQIIRDLI